MKNLKVIMHCSISLDGSFTGFEVDMTAHYQIVGNYNADIHLIGSNTAKSGIKMFYSKIPKENACDFIKPERNKNLPMWVIPDTKAQMQGSLHLIRQFDMCRDIMILVSKYTPKEYITYLKERNYTIFFTRKKQIDYEEVFTFLAKEYKVKTILTDTGRILSNILINEGLIDEISLLIHPVITGKKQNNLFNEVLSERNLKLKNSEILNKNKLWLIYKTIG